MVKFLRVLFVSVLAISFAACSNGDGGKRGKRGDGDPDKGEGAAVVRAEASAKMKKLAEYAQDNARLTIVSQDGRKIEAKVDIMDGKEVAYALEGTIMKNESRSNSLATEDGAVTADTRQIDQSNTKNPSFIYVFVKNSRITKEYPNDPNSGDMYVFTYTELDKPINILGPVSTSNSISVSIFDAELKEFEKKDINYFEFMEEVLAYFRENSGATYEDFQIDIMAELKAGNFDPLPKQPEVKDKKNPAGGNGKEYDPNLDKDVVSGSTYDGAQVPGSIKCDGECPVGSAANDGQIYAGTEYRPTRIDSQNRVVRYDNAPRPAQYVRNPVRLIEVRQDGGRVVEGRRPVDNSLAPDADGFNTIEQCLDNRVVEYIAFAKGTFDPMQGDEAHVSATGNQSCTPKIRQNIEAKVRKGKLRGRPPGRSCAPITVVEGGFHKCKIKKTVNGAYQGGSNSGSKHAGGTSSTYEDYKSSSKTKTKKSRSTGAKNEIKIASNENVGTAGGGKAKSAIVRCGASYGSTLTIFPATDMRVQDAQMCVNKPLINIGTTKQSDRMSLLGSIPNVNKISLGFNFDFTKAKKGQVFIEEAIVSSSTSNGTYTEFHSPVVKTETNTTTSLVVPVKVYDSRGNRKANYYVGCEIVKQTSRCSN